MDNTILLNRLRQAFANQSIVFDLDGTLVENIPYEEVCNEVAKCTGISFIDLWANYRSSWKGIDDAIAYHLGLCASEEGKKKIIQAYDEFRYAKSNPSINAGVVEILYKLRAQGKYLICWTQGDEKIQRTVLEKSDLLKYFSAVAVVPTKTVQSVCDYLMPLVGEKTFTMIGDYIGMDLVPVSGLAADRIWISQSRASRYRARPDVMPKDIIEVKHLVDLLKAV